MRLPFTLAVMLVLGLFCGTASARQIWLPTIDNPYCSITTYLLPELPEQAMSTMDSNEKPIIVVSALTMNQARAYGRFLMAHECCHHTLGHVNTFHRELGHLGPQPFFYIAPALKRMELEADCCAVKMLKQTHEPESIAAGRETMAKFGNEQTGAYYPTGTERAQNIDKCAAED
jgi:hypothetical protein